MTRNLLFDVDIININHLVVLYAINDLQPFRRLLELLSNHEGFKAGYSSISFWSDLDKNMNPLFKVPLDGVLLTFYSKNVYLNKDELYYYLEVASRRYKDANTTEVMIIDRLMDKIKVGLGL